MRNMRLKNYKTALKALEKLQELEPDNHEVIEKIKEIHNLRQTDFKKSMVNRLVSAKKIRLNKYLDNKNYDGALQEAYTILELDPYDTEIKSLVNKINNQKNKIKT